ncbi:TLD-domain-containing protein, partial [Phlegmacium glaucopus]
ALCRLPRSWTLVYSLDQHGISLNTFYTKNEGVGSGTRGVLLIIKDASAAEGLSVGKKGGKGYFGAGESFLWKFTEGTLYKTTGKNNYVALYEPSYISFGGGENDGHYGLYLYDTLYDGSSAPCPTFDNKPLCLSGPKKAGTSTVEFECVGLEVWGMGP